MNRSLGLLQGFEEEAGNITGTMYKQRMGLDKLFCPMRPEMKENYLIFNYYTAGLGSMRKNYLLRPEIFTEPGSCREVFLYRPKSNFKFAFLLINSSIFGSQKKKKVLWTQSVRRLNYVMVL